MRIVVDANILAAAAVRPLGWTDQRLSAEGYDFYAPAFVLDELRSHDRDFAERAGCSVVEWRGRVRDLGARVRLVPSAKFPRHRNHPLVRAIETLDPDDAPYVAAFVIVKAAFLWTRDRAIKAILKERAGPVLP